MRKLYVLFILLGAVVFAAAGVFAVYFYPRVIKPAQDYKKAVELYDAGEYVLSALRFETLGNQKQKAAEAWMKAGEECFANGELAQARTFYLKGGADSSVYKKIDDAYFQKGVTAYADNEIIEAENCFSCISSVQDYVRSLDVARIACAKRCLAEDDFEAAEKAFHFCSASSREEISSIWFEKGVEELGEFEVDNASGCFSHAAAYSSDRRDMLSRIDVKWLEAAERARTSGNRELADSCLARMNSKN